MISIYKGGGVHYCYFVKGGMYTFIGNRNVDGQRKGWLIAVNYYLILSDLSLSSDDTCFHDKDG